MEAVHSSTYAFRNFSKSRKQHPGSVFRLPGYVILDRLLLEEIDEINRLKIELHESVKQHYPNNRSRNAYYRNEFPRRVMLQVYRKIYTARTPIRALKFSWSPSTFSKEQLTSTQTFDLLLNRLKLGIDTDSNLEALLIAISKIKSLSSSTQFIIERPRAPHPVATMVQEFGRPGIREMVPLNLPIFIGPGIGGQKIEIGQLKDHNFTVRRKERSDRIASESLFKPLYLKYQL